MKEDIYMKNQAVNERKQSVYVVTANESPEPDHGYGGNYELTNILTQPCRVFICKRHETERHRILRSPLSHINCEAYQSITHSQRNIVDRVAH